MKISFDDLKNELKKRNIHLSYQRLKVLEYLAHNHCHPTADQIYTNLQKKIPTLSKTTVYNTLRVLTEAGLVRIITIEDNETRYDIETVLHGHFKCESCGTIYNFDIDIDLLTCNELDHFQIKDKSVYFKGICSNCISIKTKSE